MTASRHQVPVTVLTGFLGSGKTTLLNALLKHPGMAETAVIVNEFGEVGLDHQLVESASEDAVLLNSGCLCCTVRGDLVKTLQQLATRRIRGDVPEFKRLMVETTGLADPAPILHTLMTDSLVARDYRLDGVVTTVDAAAGAATLDRHPESVKQAAVADRLVLTKTDLAGAGAREALDARLAQLNPAAPRRHAGHGALDPEALFGAGLYDPETKTADVRRWLAAEAYESGADAQRHGHGAGHGHAHDPNRHDDRIRAVTLTWENPVDWDRFANWADMAVTLYGEHLLRLKGVVNVAGEDRPVVVHGVQHVFHPPAALPQWPDADRRTRLVAILRDLDPEVLRQTLRRFLSDRSEATR